MSDVQLSGPHTDLPAPNCDGYWHGVNDGSGSGSGHVEMRGGTPWWRGFGKLAIRPGDRWTLYVPADSQSPADRPKPDREDGSYTKPAWSGWWSRTKGTANYMTVTDGHAYYEGGAQTIVSGWRPAPIADPSEAERLKAELASSEAKRKSDLQYANGEWIKCHQALSDAGVPERVEDSDDGVCVRIALLVRDRDEARAALAERAKSVEPETPARGYKPGSADAIAEDFEIFCVGRRRYEIEALTNRIAAASSMAIRLREADSEF